ncbi:MAG: ABC transporter permease [Eubacteriaceae bacterium]
MMMALKGVLWHECIVFKRKFWTTTIGGMISPILYVIAFGWGLGSNIQVEGTNYMLFVIPGIIALNTMIVSFNTTANSINIAKLYYKTFEEFMVAPINTGIYAIGKIVAGAFYGLYSATLIIALVSIFGAKLPITPYFILIIILNCLVFSAGGFLAGLMVKSHADMAKFTSFIITPMSFLCGTFFSISKMPFILDKLIWILPLTHTSLGLRSNGEELINMLQHPLILLIYFVVLFIAGIRYCKTAE